MTSLSDLERRVASGDASLTPSDFVRAHGILDALYDQHAQFLLEKAASFSKCNVFGARLTESIRRIGKDMAVPVHDR